MGGPIANLLIGLGILLVVVGLIAKTGLLGWFGHLPGDIQIKRENFQLYLPITSMILVSLALSALLALIRRLF
jgi:Ca2+/Na+ antiporter